MSLVWSDLASQGLAGDMFGAVNALFSALAFARIVFTILMQKEELRPKRQELTETRKEFEKQNESLNIQRFENTFFTLLELHKQVLQGVSVQSQARAVSAVGRQALVQTNTHPEVEMSRWNYDPTMSSRCSCFACLKDVFAAMFK